MNTYSQTKGGGPTAQHTPTPWHFAKQPKGSKRPSWEAIYSEGGFHILTIWQDGGRSVLPEQAEANARFVLTACNSYESSQRRIKELEGALRKAKTCRLSSEVLELVNAALQPKEDSK